MRNKLKDISLVRRRRCHDGKWMDTNLTLYGDDFRHNQAARQLHVSCLRGRSAAFAALLRTDREADLSPLWCRPQRAARLEAVRPCDAALQRHHLARDLRHRAVTADPPLESTKPESRAG